ncbi:ATP-binding protein [Streptomyces blattellae]|uniref:ATP-binding protein n=1 Tax=Streptomyces blattellae TaxID=2569855 RepID=UPI001E4BAE5B|nr:ATP-binding protein [Streptomyces blattellae]
MSGRTHSKRFRLRKDAVPVARDHVRAILTSWLLGELADDAESIVGELAANAVVHARGIGEFFEVGLRRLDGVLIVEVSDSFQWRMPERRDADPADDCDGRGLAIVEALSDKWGVRPREAGKTIWAHLSVTREEAAC